MLVRTCKDLFLGLLAALPPVLTASCLILLQSQDGGSGSTISILVSADCEYLAG